MSQWQNCITTQITVSLTTSQRVITMRMWFGAMCELLELDFSFLPCPHLPFIDTQVTPRNFQLLSVLGSALRLKAEADSSSRGQKDFICRAEKRKAAWGHAAGSGNWWSYGSGWKLHFTAFFCIAWGQICQVQTDVYNWEGEVFPWLIINFWDLLQSVLQVPPLNDRHNWC
jgi:hypothetical protein